MISIHANAAVRTETILVVSLTSKFLVFIADTGEAVEMKSVSDEPRFDVETHWLDLFSNLNELSTYSIWPYRSFL